jgi:hypothetical protein
MNGSAVETAALKRWAGAKGLSVRAVFLFAVALFIASGLQAQQAELSGTVEDESGGAIKDASVTIENTDTNLKQTTTTNSEGIYRLPPLAPGNYRISVAASGFEAKVLDRVRLTVAEKNFRPIVLAVGHTNQSVTVDSSGVGVNTIDASVSSVIDHQFVENLPLNGRSFQSLMTMIPGVALVASQGPGLSGDLSVNGQRSEANYYTVDGVSANSGTVAGLNLGMGAGPAGAVPGQTALGTTQSTVPVDALQEFRAITSTYSAEYGRTPGGQFAFTTRSGTNNWHGSLFEYFRNDKLDANNWFNNYNGIGKTATRQNDFGGTFGGPVVLPKVYDGRDRTFFFFSYEGMRLRSPQAAITTEVPSLAVREGAPAELRPFLNAFSRPNGPEVGNGNAYFTAAYSSPSSLDTTGIRIDHSINDRFKLFGRFSVTPSSITTRYSYGLSALDAEKPTSKLVTLGATNILSAGIYSDLRFNYTWNDVESKQMIDSFGGAVPLSFDSIPGLNEGTQGWLYFRIPGNNYPTYGLSPSSSRQRQFNIVETLNWSRGAHNIKWGVDYRRIATTSPLPTYYIQAGFGDLDEILINRPSILRVFHSDIAMRPVYDNFSAFVQDEWRLNSRLNLSLGLRWEVNPAPHDAGGNNPYNVDQIDNLATTKLARQGTPLWNTTYRNFAPRFGLAYQVNRKPGFETVLRLGSGVFYDMGNTQGSSGYFYAAGITSSAFFPTGFPLTQQQIDSIPAPSAEPPYNSQIRAFDPNLRLPYTVQWNVSLEQALGSKQTVTLSYVGSTGKRLLAQLLYDPAALGNPNFPPATVSSISGLYLTDNSGRSNYNSFQAQFQRRLSRHFQALASYTWSHSIDNASSNFALMQLLRGDSDFDLRHNFQASVSYDGVAPFHAPVLKALNHWSADLRLFARSAPPVNVIGFSGMDAASGASLDFQPDRVAGQPLYLKGAGYPGGRRINPAAFEAVAPGVQGNLGRNAARGFGATQVDLAVRRDFTLTERCVLQVRAESFNLFNHANFGGAYSQIADPRFGLASTMLNGQLGGLNPLYQVGGPRSMQLALKLRF